MNTIESRSAKVLTERVSTTQEQRESVTLTAGIITEPRQPGLAAKSNEPQPVRHCNNPESIRATAIILGKAHSFNASSGGGPSLEIFFWSQILKLHLESLGW
jgi:hypothetical protein